MVALSANVNKIALKIAKNAPLALATTINCVNKKDKSYRDFLDFEAKDFASLFETKDTLEGMSAFIDKRKANFKGK